MCSICLNNVTKVCESAGKGQLDLSFWRSEVSRLIFQSILKKKLRKINLQSTLFLNFCCSLPIRSIVIPALCPIHPCNCTRCLLCQSMSATHGMNFRLLIKVFSISLKGFSVGKFRSTDSRWVRGISARDTKDSLKDIPGRELICKKVRSPTTKMEYSSQRYTEQICCPGHK